MIDNLDKSNLIAAMEKAVIVQQRQIEAAQQFKVFLSSILVKLKEALE